VRRRGVGVVVDRDGLIVREQGGGGGGICTLFKTEPLELGFELEGPKSTRDGPGGF
jgi:hypothetical protein